MKNLIRLGKTTILAVILISLLLTPGQASAASFTITPGSMNGWGVMLDSGTTPAVHFVTGPGSPPAGTGSARFVTPAINDGIYVGTADYLGTPLSDISTITYSTYRSAGGSDLAVSFQINIDYDTTDLETGWQGRLVYEPYHSGTSPSTGVWETWDALDPNARWWGSNTTFASPCVQATPCSWEDVLLNFPNAAVHPTLGGILFKGGSSGTPWIGFDGNVDNLTFGVLDANDTFDFENIAPANVYVDDGWTGTIVGTDPDGAGPATVYGGDAFDNIQDGVTAVATAGTVNVFAGTYPENVVVNKSMTIDGTGNGTDPGVDTILDGSSLTGRGFYLPSNITDVTITDLRIQDYSNATGSGIWAQGENHNFTAQNLHLETNGIPAPPVSAAGGIYMNGPVDMVLIDNVTAIDNEGRGIVIWNGFKSNITITDNYVEGSNCCGIELQDGTASGVTMTGNTSINNADSGMSAVGLTSGAGPNLIADNIITNNGRFGLEIKNPDGTGLDSGEGSIVIENNTVSFDGPPTDDRDHAGIAVFRRGVLAGNVNIPTGVIVRNNSVTGYLQTSGSSDSEGFGIVVEGTNMQVLTNTVSSNDVGLQVQAGHLPYPGDGNQNDLPDSYFGRGNSPIGCAEFRDNIDGGGNGVLLRSVGTSGAGTVTNIDTGESFCSIQSAIDDLDTLNGHTLDVGPGTYIEAITINKSLTINGPNVGIAGDSGSRVSEATILPDAIGFDPFTVCTILAYIEVDEVTLDGLTFDGNNPALTSGELINGVDVDACEGIVSYESVGNITIENNVISNFTYIGIELYNYYNGAVPTSDNYIRFNRITNLGNFNFPYGIGTLIYNDFYADISQNVYDDVRIGIQTGNFNNANPGATGQISQNEINAWRTGIAHNLWYGSAGLISVDNNTINAIDQVGQATWYGMWIASWQNSANTMIIDNIVNIGSISQLASGYNVWNTPTTADLTIFGGSVDGGDYGVFVNNYDGYDSDANDTSIIVDGLTISNAGLAGVYVKDNPNNSNGALVDAVVQNSTINNSSDTAITVEGPEASGIFKGLTIDTSLNVFDLTDGDLQAYANNITNFTDGGLTSVGGTGTFEARRNWWGSHFTQPAGVDSESWDYRLGAAVETWAEGDGTATLDDSGNPGTAQLSGGTGTAVIVSHGRPSSVSEAPFGNGVNGFYNQMCSDFYDMFLLTGAAGTWTASVPLDDSPGCAMTLTDEVIFWIPWGTVYTTECTPASNGFCWDPIDVADVFINGDNLDVQNLTFTDLSGTPIVAGSDSLTDPTAITLSLATAREPQSIIVVLIAVLLLGVTTWFVLLSRRSQRNQIG